MTKKILAASLSAVVAVALGACSADPHEVTDFVPEKEKLTKYDLIPLDGVWRNPATANKQYDSIMVEPVFTKDALAQRSWMERNNMRAWMDDEDEDIAEFAQYTEKAFKRELAKCQRMKLVSKPGPKTLMLQLALVKVVPGKPVMSTLGAIGSVTPVGLILLPIKFGANAAGDSPMKASVAIEGVVRDATTKEVVATFADREKATTAILNAQDFSSYGNLHEIVDEWAKIIAQIIDKRPLKTGTKIEGHTNVKAINM